MMKKWFIIATITIVAMLLMAPGALALTGPYTHGDFATNSKGCADCHVTHAASAQKLLKTGATQTAFCLSCHSNAAIASPFDVYRGKILNSGKFNATTGTVTDTTYWNDSAWTSPSLAGGFRYSYDFDVDDGVITFSNSVTSIHNVRGSAAEFGNLTDITAYDYVYGDTIPGGTKNIDFECGSCHDPHAGGAYADDNGVTNPRLLKKVLPADGTNRIVKMQINQTNNVPTNYTSGFNGWCGGCHDIFNTASTTRAGYTLEGGRTKYMHQFNKVVNDTVYGGSTNPYNIKKLALETEGGKKISCITCHRAHGTSAAALPATWNRYDTYRDYDGSSGIVGSVLNSGKGSALLRLKNRDVCYKCHAEAKYNLH